MKREIIITSDGSSTIHIPEWNEQYHSKHGAIQEAYHVFIKHGLEYVLDKSLTSTKGEKISILEIGFGTGLNTLITLIEAEKKQVQIEYCGVEAYPISDEEVNHLNYVSELHIEEKSGVFEAIHNSSWEVKHEINEGFSLTKQKKFFKDITDSNLYDLIYFDAFGARVQPELWTEAIFSIMFKALKEGGVLVTYAAKGSVRRAMQAVGFTVTKLPGPPGKREMLRGEKVKSEK
ncbi:tRNA (5-methylaminomethyl-2-thiouridine)(34)-methyltransferase MnmD [Tamlana sp. s12]|uniref:tRNA (5-methylaminomethyl-2-thiouridine)(34)-methyltransferase MnmD n=1 Tax=Tamlana sp. s12 TaxID=1630406 RepID=UPI0008010FC9|nr:tRNA (5-methylaminomethyl-2-thiouridine)(34)-methyltransferase MnmD [Tamlana sp. s12]OBQ56469.1 SAM-dependent methyltransferase [Tamlana sp. s12]QQY81907.1 tRNA (5-methylaminomethyl-2-thiouridine)(34)-methyltransferase MnmD [Tamlana sp. s12]